MLNIAVIGCGMVAEGHLNAISQLKEWKLAAIVEANPERLRETERRFGTLAAFASYTDLFSAAGGGALPLDAVVVSTHVETHYEITMAALRQGLHVLCEKPMAETAERCREMEQEAKHRGLLLAVNFNTRSSEPYRTIKRVIDRGDVGPIRVVRFVYDWSAHQWTPLQRVERFMENGGPVIDSAVHFFDGVRWYTGSEFERIDACGVIEPPYPHPQHVIAACKLENGAIALVEAGWLYTKSTKDSGMLHNVTVIGDDATLDYNSASQSLRIWTKDTTEEIECTDLDKHFEYVHTRFAESIRRGELVELASGHDGALATAAAFQALVSAHRTA